ncbi:Helix-turn-helix domain-containing protein [Draconibacterium orientale]|uniref:DNA-binding protein n=2 Tax=Draconibacterium orientale TaxID=1168034 RepID=X5DIU8_9BACT|nr:DNA-binding protein [Draconibacterium orientale]SET55385.1 Helix-turn-helix domain-containing protein [Draconibacterium orientale]
MEITQLLLELSSAIKEIKAHLLVLKQTRTEKFKQAWIDGQEVMLALSISKRTLQSLRDAGTLPYSRINGKFYYKVADLEKLLESNYSQNLKNESHD